MRRALVIGIVIGVLAASRVASAQIKVDLQASAGGSWMRSAPSVGISPTEGNTIRVPDGDTARLGIPLGFVGIGAGIDVRLSRALYLPTLGVSWWRAVGSSPTVVTSVDGSIVQLRPYRASLLDVTLLGIGVRAPLRRWLVSADVAFSLTIFTIPGVVAAGAYEEETTGIRASPTIRIDVAGCRRFDPSNRLCLALSPNVYSFGLFNGGTLTLRWEIGS